MKRLTKKEQLAGHTVNYVDCDACFDVWSVPKKFMGNAIDRLAAYEDTKLEPEEIKSLQAEYAVNLKVLESYRSIGSVDRLRELAQADKEGRCVVLPFKPPRWVYMCSARFPKPAQAHYASAINVLQDMDKGCVFGDTPEEAEAALRREQDGQIKP